MEPTTFKEQTVVYAEDQPEYIPLPACVKPGPQGEVVSVWELSFRERLKILFTGRMYLSLWMFRNEQGKVRPLTPQRLTVNKSEVLP